MKRCSGTGKAKDFEGCGVELPFSEKNGLKSYKAKYGLGTACKCYSKWLLSTEEGNKVFAKSIITGKSKVAKNYKKKHREEKEKNKSISKLISEARKPFHKWIRFRDANKPCISCGSIDSKIWDAGHFYKAELYTALIFDERNVNKQCRKCNTFLGGNENNYRLGLIKRYGEEFVNNLDLDSKSKRTYKFTKEEIRNIKIKYQNKNTTQWQN